MTLSSVERAEIAAWHEKGAAIFRKTGKYPSRPQRIIELQKKAVEPVEPDTPPRPAPAPVVEPIDVVKRTAEIKAARRKEADENQAEINRILSVDIPGTATWREKTRRGDRPALAASDMEDGKIIPGRRSFRLSTETGQRRQ